MLSAADREIRLGIWKIHILHHAASRDVWGRWLLEELAEHGHDLARGHVEAHIAQHGLRAAEFGDGRKLHGRLLVLKGHGRCALQRCG